MKLNSINLIKFTKNLKTQKQITTKANLANQNTNLAATNSMNEAIGRNQVSFKGVTCIINDDGTMTVSGAKSFQYNPATGELSYEERPGYDGIKLRTISYNPTTSTKKIVEEYKDKITTTTTTPDKKTIETIDNQKRQTYYHEIDSTKTETTKITDYDARKRRVETVKIPGMKDQIKVFDLDLHEYVTTGEKVKDRIITDTGSEVRNIITGEVYERVVLGNSTLTITTFNEAKPSIKEKEVVKNGNGNKTTSFNPDGTKKQVVEINSNGNIKKTINYAPDETESDKEIIELYPNGQVKTKTKFFPNTEKINIIEEHDAKTGAKTIHYFDSKTELKTSSVVTENDEIITETIYQEDGKTPKTIKKYSPDKSYSIEYFPSIKSGKFDQSKAKYINRTTGKASIEVFSKDGKTKIDNCSLDTETSETIYIDTASGIPYAQQESERRKEYYTADDVLKRTEYIDTATGKVYLEEYADENEGYIREYKDSVTGITTEKVYITEDQEEVWQREIFHEDSNVIQSRIIYQGDECIETLFDEMGNIIKENPEEEE